MGLLSRVGYTSKQLLPWMPMASVTVERHNMFELEKHAGDTRTFVVEARDDCALTAIPVIRSQREWSPGVQNDPMMCSSRGCFRFVSSKAKPFDSKSGVKPRATSGRTLIWADEDMAGTFGSQMLAGDLFFIPKSLCTGCVD